MKNDYELIALSQITTKAREIAVAWIEALCHGMAIEYKHKLASDIMNYALECVKHDRDRIKWEAKYIGQVSAVEVEDIDKTKIELI